MQVLHRKGEDCEQRQASPDAGSAALAPPVPEENIIVDDELEIRASHITAAAVAAASVTAAVVTEAAAAAADALREPLPAQDALPAALPLPDVQRQPQPELQPRARSAGFTDAAHEASGSPRAAWPVSLLTLAAIGLALWWSAQWPWPQRALKPMVRELPSLRKPVAPPPAVPAPAAAVAAADAEPAPLRDEIAILQQDAEDRAQLLAQKRAATEARHRREDAALALREQRRSQAEAQLAAARAKAERAQAAALPQPEVVEVAPAPTLADQVQQCRSLSLFSRESCLWKLCNGQWGKNGCPSYEQNSGGA
jgi:hypothetical protein